MARVVKMAWTVHSAKKAWAARLLKMVGSEFYQNRQQLQVLWRLAEPLQLRGSEVNPSRGALGSSASAYAMCYQKFLREKEKDRVAENVRSVLRQGQRTSCYIRCSECFFLV